MAKVAKLLVLIAGISILNIAAFSPGLLHIQIRGGSPAEAAFGITLPVISLLILFFASYTLLLKPRPSAVPQTAARELRTPEDYAAALAPYRRVKPLRSNLDLAADQMERMEKKKSTLQEVLADRFEPGEMSYRKFAAVIGEVEKLFYLNVRGMLNKLSVFDAEEFARFAGQQKTAPFSTRLIQQKTDLYKEYMAHIEGYIGANEEILLKLDKLLLEMSLLGSADYRELEEMPGMKEIDALIKQTKFYND